MPETLIKKAQYAFGAEDDDFFRPEAILGYLNHSQKTVATLGASMERKSQLRLDVLNDLRVVREVTVDGIVSIQENFDVSSASLPTDMLSVIMATYRSPSVIRMTELPPDKKKMLESGYVLPTLFQFFYQIINTGSVDTPDKIIKIWGKGITKDTDNVEVYGIVKPKELVATDTSLQGLPDTLTNAVLYNACVSMALQEEDLNKADKFRQKFQEEIELTLH
ncbi:hypothetical protein ACKGJO_06580 [Gracilimonas sp. Q87]|uniref:phage adaptor protein n=1 Tax=Gracilimonas sp. Q87 TaxID=3384766 RepID=UPI00398407D3